MRFSKRGGACGNRPPPPPFYRIFNSSVPTSYLSYLIRRCFGPPRCEVRFYRVSLGGGARKRSSSWNFIIANELVEKITALQYSTLHGEERGRRRRRRRRNGCRLSCPSSGREGKEERGGVEISSRRIPLEESNNNILDPVSMAMGSRLIQ